jgi:large subunit ribosomal protein L10
VNRDQKAAVVDELAEEIGNAQAVLAVDYRGISVPQAAQLRTKLRETNATFRIVKNSLTERAADKAGADGLKALLDGPTALTFVRGDAAPAAKALRDAQRATQLLEFKGGDMGAIVLTGDEVRSIAALPPREVLYAQLVGTVAAPLTGLVRALGSMISGLAIALQQIHDEGKVGQGAPAAEAAPAEEPAAEAAPTEEAEAAPADQSEENAPAASGEDTTPADAE